VDELEAHAVVVRADALNLLGRYDEALRLVSPILADNSTHLPSGVAAAVSLLHLRRDDEAVTLLSRLAGAHPNSPDAVRLLSLAAVRRGDSAAAVAHAARAVELAPAALDVHLQYSVALAAAQRRADAVASARLALEIDPDSAAAHLAMADALLLGDLTEHPGDLALAEQHIRQILAADPNHAPAHNALGRVSSAKGEIFAAISSISRAVAADPRQDVLVANVVALLARIILMTYFGFCALWWIDLGAVIGGEDGKPVLVGVAVAVIAAVVAPWLRLRRVTPLGVPHLLRDFRRRDPAWVAWAGVAAAAGALLAVLPLTSIEVTRVLFAVAGGLLAFVLVAFGLRVKAARRHARSSHTIGP
jgi:tetratricopeptide (TPR) repeat protein